MKSNKIIAISSIIIIALCGIIGGSVYIYKWSTESTLGIMLSRKNISSEKLVENLSSKDRNLVMTSLSILSNRKSPLGKEKAYELLESKDDYIWFNACQYLAILKDMKSVPYLIKGLKHPASRSYDGTALLLKELTKESFGKDQKKWIAWWEKNHPDESFSFIYQKLRDEAKSLNSSHSLFINGVVDPLRISHVGPKIRLIGIKLKEGADQQKAILLLKQLVICQWVKLQFDKGEKLDEEGARRALVFWERKGSPKMSKIMRRNLPLIPFNTKTLINTYLLKSGLYELDLKDIKKERIRNLLEGKSSKKK